MHVGTFTKEGTWDAAARELPALRELGSDGGRGHARGRLRRGGSAGATTASTCTRPRASTARPTPCAPSWTRRTRLGLGVILDVVYNHLGPSGNYLPQFSERYFTDKYGTEWGEPFNYDGEDSAPVREFIVANAAYWIAEFHLDGLRLDATQSMHDASPEHVLAAVAREARRAAGPRSIILVAENEPQQTRLVRPPEQGGYGIDALWNDDFHHSAMVALTGRSEAYYSDYRGDAPGVRLRPQIRLPLSRPGVPLAGQAPRHSVVRGAAAGFRDVHPEPRPGGQLRPRSARAPALQPRAVARDDGADAAGPGHADALPGAGVRLVEAVPLLRRPRGRSREGRAHGTPPFPVAVPQPGPGRVDARPARSVRSRDLRGLPARPCASASTIAKRGFSIAISCGCAARIPCSAGRAQAGLDGAVLGPHAFVMRFFGTGGDDRLLVVNLGARRALQPRARATAGSARGTAVDGALVERGARVRRVAGRSRPIRPRGGVCPARARCCSRHPRTPRSPRASPGRS